MDSLTTAIKVSASGLGAETTRLRVVSENIANAHSTSSVSGGDPFQRKLVTFRAELDRATNASQVDVESVRTDNSDFRLEYNPVHPAADSTGFVKMPNVDVLIEMADMRASNRSYQANLQVLKQARDLISMTIDLMRSR